MLPVRCENVSECMLAWLLLGLVGFAIWKLNTGRSAFISRFASLLQQPVFGRGSLLSRRQHLGGTFEGSPVTLLLQPRVGRRLGYLIIATEARTPFVARIGRRSSMTPLARVVGGARTSPVGDAELDEKFVFDIDDVFAVRAWIQDERVRRAVGALVADLDLSLAIENGLVQATWMPVGFFIFPGRFDPQRWRSALEHIRALAATLR